MFKYLLTALTGGVLALMIGVSIYSFVASAAVRNNQPTPSQPTPPVLVQQKYPQADFSKSAEFFMSDSESTQSGPGYGQLVRDYTIQASNYGLSANDKKQAHGCFGPESSQNNGKCYGPVWNLSLPLAQQQKCDIRVSVYGKTYDPQTNRTHFFMGMNDGPNRCDDVITLFAQVENYKTYSDGGASVVLKLSYKINGRYGPVRQLPDVTLKVGPEKKK